MLLIHRCAPIQTKTWNIIVIIVEILIKDKQVSPVVAVVVAATIPP